MSLVFIIAAVITGFVAASLCFFQTTRKTYPGFGYWTAGVGVIAVGYLLIGIRGQIPFWISILSNMLFPLGMVLHLDGIRRFFGLSPASKWWYTLPAVVAGGIIVFYCVWDEPVLRGCVISVSLVAVHWTMAALLFSGDLPYKSVFRRTIAFLLVTGAALILARAIWMISDTGFLLFRSPGEFVFFTLFILIHLGENLSMVMLNAERVEDELLEAEAGLSQTVARLEEALARQKIAEKSLRESEERYKTFFDTSRDAVFISTTTGQFVDFNDVALEMLGYSPNDRQEVMTKSTFSFYVRPEDREIHVAAVSRMGFLKDYPVDLRKKDGTIIHSLVTTVAKKDSSGNVVGFQGTFRDITELKKADDALRESEERYRLIFNNAPLGIMHFDSSGVIVDFNERFSRIIGAERNAILGFNMLERVKDPMMLEAVQQCLNSGSGYFEGDYLSVTGNKSTPVRALYSRIDSDDGRFLGAIGLFEDISERRKAQRQLQEREQMLASILSASPIGIALTNVERKLIWVNDSWLRIFGFERYDECVGRSTEMLYPSKEEFIRLGKIIQSALVESRVIDAEAKMVRKDGTVFDAHVRLNPVDPTDENKGYISALEDISEKIRTNREREQLKNQLFQAQKAEAIGTLAGGIAHDFNNLLTIILGYSEILLQETDENTLAHEDLQKIVQSAQNGSDLIQRLLMLSKRAETHPIFLDLNRQIRETMALWSRSIPKTIWVELSLDDNLGLVRADPAQIDQILMNLANNAEESMENGGKLTVTTSMVTLDDEFCRRHPEMSPGNFALLTVSDTGRGMDEETQERMFDPFFTIKGWDSRKGKGLGLPVVLGIVQQHGGCIECLSEVGKGTVFRIYLPIFETQPSPEQEISPTMPAKGTETILLADDEVLVRDLGSRFLTKSGYRVLTAANGREALAIYKEHRSNISLVILDLIMPEMDGAQCLNELVKIDPHVRVIVSSGHSDSERLKDVHFESIKAFVKKPYDVKQFLSVVRSVLDAE
ncbi:PAS domain-containing hybrid sensor histidine kinase/response regulator [Desulfomonile tiedjei]|uniref:histidine kinase n=1 Tax=Desulfomonile tiedjei (strain ATCC 49306 / DSM 6799 / DCB-1) TaxID=706587 RepID=I4C9B9_DESTA|nr:PAS domain-containing sensor histidine kinase [Desulfomonile tiedjei]AFM26160.1 PAS domain S-box [Desulfomonile tiedjei DSM 6799]